MTYKIAVFGSAKENLEKKFYDIAEKTGKFIAKEGHILITGAAKGISAHAAKGAKTEKGRVIGISPTKNISEKEDYQVDFRNIDEIVHTAMGYKGRNVISVRRCDGAIIINGGFGTLNEVTIAEGENKPLVVIENTGGCADITREIFKKLNPQYPLVAYCKTPKDAVKKVLALIKSKDNLNNPKA